MTERPLRFSPQLKSANDLGEASFLAAIFGNVDLGGDIVEPGAFSKVISSTSAARIPFTIDHSQSRRDQLGLIAGLQEVPEGLLVDVKFNLDKEIARDIYSDFRTFPESQQFSFAYATEPAGTFYDPEGVRHIKEVSALYDVSSVVLGMNTETRLLAVKEGRRDEEQTPFLDIHNTLRLKRLKAGALTRLLDR